MDIAARYSEATASARIAAVPMSHVSIEVGHFYMNDLTNGEDRIRAQFREVKEYLDFIEAKVRRRYGRNTKVSTCFLVDDYFGPDTDPARIIGKLLAAAAECDMRIDYLAREEGCFEAPVYTDGVATGIRIPLAEMVSARVVPEPVQNTTGRRPPTDVSGWLCNGRRSSDDEPQQAMRLEKYRPAEEYGRREHSIFLDAQLWAPPTKKTRARPGQQRVWSCPFLASIWQLLRLGMLRYEGAAVAEPQEWDPAAGWPESWRDLPTVVRLNPEADPFSAFESMSILPHRYVEIEHAVRVILAHVKVDDAVIDEAIWSGVAEGVTVPRKVTERLGHVLLPGS
ncbi:SCO2522 family protein [Nocardia amikacinitolerans]|uniref:Uncharacterized protein n=1 Tax=Nocardia amikacinitolerans TaxID=756689 RepID=A0A285L6F8_9NOCA|nr:SCO2522 family protein [Nocardia amikacinitolerans]MCP2274751.1 hypothetical protein [Nocardia amikacinitolerans]MCP2289996.1 hypothetical protein [Nocardia amikacinitolerans]MCP2296499.1 hypothetical protein [Nocardia amikacinitolerans]SNY80535.1 hypothetical protein SAMN04244553_2106 [Nocardia amikacinitolerans]